MGGRGQEEAVETVLLRRQAAVCGRRGKGGDAGKRGAAGIQRTHTNTQPRSSTQPHSHKTQILNVMMINCPGGPRKGDDSDHPLQETMLNFTVNQIR